MMQLPTSGNGGSQPLRVPISTELGMTTGNARATPPQKSVRFDEIDTAWQGTHGDGWSVAPCAEVLASQPVSE